MSSSEFILRVAFPIIVMVGSLIAVIYYIIWPDIETMMREKKRRKKTLAWTGDSELADEVAKGSISELRLDYIKRSGVVVRNQTFDAFCDILDLAKKGSLPEEDRPVLWLIFARCYSSKISYGLGYPTGEYRCWKVSSNSELFHSLYLADQSGGRLSIDTAKGDYVDTLLKTALSYKSKPHLLLHLFAKAVIKDCETVKTGDGVKSPTLKALRELAELIIATFVERDDNVAHEYPYPLESVIGLEERLTH